MLRSNIVLFVLYTDAKMHRNPILFFNRWFKVDGVGLRQVLPSPKIKHHLEVLILQELLVEDSGIYVCIMNNTAGAERIEVNLTVRSSLDTLVTPSQQTIDLNQAAIFTCTVTGYPKQHVYWIKNGQTLQLDGHRWVLVKNIQTTHVADICKTWQKLFLAIFNCLLFLPCKKYWIAFEVFDLTYIQRSLCFIIPFHLCARKNWKNLASFLLKIQ